MSPSDSVALRAAIRAITPMSVVVACYLFFAGHNQPGGGFAAGLVIGTVIALRSVAGVPPTVSAIALLSSGAMLAVGVAIAPIVFGSALLDQSVVSFTAPLLGSIKSGSAIVFDLAVVAIVVGLITAVLEGMGGSGGADDGVPS